MHLGHKEAGSSLLLLLSASKMARTKEEEESHFFSTLLFEWPLTNSKVRPTTYILAVVVL